MRPVASTWVASMQNIAAPDSARLLMCVKCQSLASPLSAEYWHIGATMMRLRRFNSRSLIGENRALMRGMSGFFEGGRALQHLGPAGAIASGRGRRLLTLPWRVETSEARSLGRLAIERSEMRDGAGCSLNSGTVRNERPSPHPAALPDDASRRRVASTQRASFARLDPSRGGYQKNSLHQRELEQ